MARRQYHDSNITVNHSTYVCLMISGVIYRAFIQAVLLSTAVFPQIQFFTIRLVHYLHEVFPGWTNCLQIDRKCISETLFLTAKAYTTQKKKFSIKDFFSNYDQI